MRCEAKSRNWLSSQVSFPMSTVDTNRDPQVPEDKYWAELLSSAPAQPFRGQVARCIAKAVYDSGQPPRYLFTSGRAGRCNLRGTHCLYTSEDRETAQREYDRYAVKPDKPEPELVFYGELIARKVLDLNDPAVRTHFGLMEHDFYCSIVALPRPPRLQHLGKAIADQGKQDSGSKKSGPCICAIRFPSNACRQLGKTGRNIAVFPDALLAPDSFEILGPNGNILEQWP